MHAYLRIASVELSISRSVKIRFTLCSHSVTRSGINPLLCARDCFINRAHTNTEEDYAREARKGYGDQFWRPSAYRTERERTGGGDAGRGVQDRADLLPR